MSSRFYPPAQVTTRTFRYIFACAALCHLSAGAAFAQPTQQGINPPNNPRALRATQVLERRPQGERARVRFEWDQVSGARAYVLIGRWTQPPSWTIQSREFRVSRQNASSWTGKTVTYDLALPPGNHSWRVMTLGTRNGVDSTSAAALSFEVK